MDNLQVGDVLWKVMHGFQDELWRNEARVTRISDDVIECVVYVDVPRTMKFDRRTGVNILGNAYGWLEEK